MIFFQFRKIQQCILEQFISKQYYNLFLMLPKNETIESEKELSDFTSLTTLTKKTQNPLKKGINFIKSINHQKQTEGYEDLIDDRIDGREDHDIGEDQNKNKHFWCRICQTKQPLRRQRVFDDCGHTFCENCLAKFMEEKLSRFERVVCPQQNCEQFLSQDTSIFSGLVSNQSSFKRIITFYKVSDNPNTQFCPSTDCPGIIHKPFPGQNAHCNSCSKNHCWGCLFPAHRGECQSNAIDYLVQHFRLWQCTNCKSLIDTDNTCQQISCKCGYSVCYNCEEPWQASHHCDINRREQEQKEIRRRDEEERTKQRRRQIFWGITKILPLILFLILALIAVSYIQYKIALAQNICPLLWIKGGLFRITLRTWFLIDAVTWLPLIMIIVPCLLGEMKKNGIVGEAVFIISFALSGLFVLIKLSQQMYWLLMALAFILTQDGDFFYILGCTWSPLSVSLLSLLFTIIVCFITVGLIGLIDCLSQI